MHPSAGSCKCPTTKLPYEALRGPVPLARIRPTGSPSGLDPTSKYPGAPGMSRPRYQRRSGQYSARTSKVGPSSVARVHLPLHTSRRLFEACDLSDAPDFDRAVRGSFGRPILRHNKCRSENNTGAVYQVSLSGGVPNRGQRPGPRTADQPIGSRSWRVLTATCIPQHLRPSSATTLPPIS